MKKLLVMLAGTALIALSGPTLAADELKIGKKILAADELKIGKKIYDRAFGRGCGTCHDISSNPQLKKLIKEDKLDLAKFSKVVKNGKNAMPKAIEQIMAIGPVKKAGYTEDEAIAALYKYLSKK